MERPMSSSHLLRTAIATFGLFVVTTPLALAQTSTDGIAEPTVTTRTAAEQESRSVPVEAQNCRYKPLPGSHIKVHVCTSREGVEYRMDRRARTNAVVIAGLFASAPIAAPLPQVQ
jgi:hypothetical protein